MYFQDLFKLLEQRGYFIFSFEDILTFFPGENRPNLKRLIFRWKKQGRIASLKRGLYELTYPQDRRIPDLYVANRLYGPSYVSLETAVSDYSLIPEVSMAVTSLTTRPTRRFKNKHGLFIYRTVRPAVFTGYRLVRHGEYKIYQADPEKALVDFLYFKTFHNKDADLRQERLNKKTIRKMEIKKLKYYAGLYKKSWEELYARI